jgi:hypothetical protein
MARQAKRTDPARRHKFNRHRPSGLKSQLSERRLGPHKSDAITVHSPRERHAGLRKAGEGCEPVVHCRDRYARARAPR